MSFFTNFRSVLWMLTFLDGLYPTPSVYLWLAHNSSLWLNLKLSWLSINKHSLQSSLLWYFFIYFKNTNGYLHFHKSHYYKKVHSQLFLTFCIIHTPYLYLNHRAYIIHTHLVWIVLSLSKIHSHLWNFIQIYFL